MAGTGGKRENSGRKTAREERELREALKTYLPDLYKVIDDILENGTKEEKIKVLKIIVDKLLANPQVMDITSLGKQVGSPFTDEERKLIIGK